jgi:chromate transport protein ChrA
MRNQNKMPGLINAVILIFLFSIFMLISRYLIEAEAFASTLASVQANIIGLSGLQQINQTYGNNPLMQIIISKAQSNITAIFNSQISRTTQAVNKLSYTYDLFHNLSSIKDFLEIFATPLIIIIISIIIIIYIYIDIYKCHKNSYL